MILDGPSRWFAKPQGQSNCKLSKFDTTVSVINNIVEKMYKVGLEAMPNLDA